MTWLNDPKDIEYEGQNYPAWRGDFYASGEPKSALRGQLHEICIAAAAIYLVMIVQNTHGPLGTAAAAMFSTAQITLYVVSSQFHRRRWSLPGYLRMRQLDHAAIYLISAASAMPSAALLHYSGFIAAATALFAWAWGIAVLGIIHVLVWPQTQSQISKTALSLMALAGGCVVPFSYYMWLVMTSLEWWTICSGWALLAVSVLTYKFHWGDFVPDIWGYHETFHLVQMAAMIFVATFNYSMVARITN